MDLAIVSQAIAQYRHGATYMWLWNDVCFRVPFAVLLYRFSLSLCQEEATSLLVACGLCFLPCKSSSLATFMDPPSLSI
jgi:hypothetical protein